MVRSRHGWEALLLSDFMTSRPRLLPRAISGSMILSEQEFVAIYGPCCHQWPSRCLKSHADLGRLLPAGAIMCSSPELLLSAMCGSIASVNSMCGSIALQEPGSELTPVALLAT